LAKANNLKGIGMWALGYDGSRTELWNAIEKRFVTVDVNENEIGSPKFMLAQNYPNPFNPETVISYQLSVFSKVTLKVFDVLGNEVAILVDDWKEAGGHNYELGIRNYELPSGVYFYQLRAGKFLQTKKMIYLK
jgi:hypothetical protein